MRVSDPLPPGSDFRSKLSPAQLGLLGRLHDGDARKAWAGAELNVTAGLLGEAAEETGSMRGGEVLEECIG